MTLAEYQAVGEALFRQIDTDKDGTVSQQELMDFRTRAERAGCEMPAASEKARVVVLSSYETEALSSVTLGSQDNVVHAGRVVVEPGNEPIYVVIASYSPTIWQFSGAVERVERLVMASARTGRTAAIPINARWSARTGIVQDKVSFFSKSNCLTYFNETPSSASLQTLAAIRSGTGKAPETVAAKYSVAVFKVPSGGIESLREQGKGPLIIEKTQGTLKVIGNASGRHRAGRAQPRQGRDVPLLTGRASSRSIRRRWSAACRPPATRCCRSRPDWFSCWRPEL